MDVMFNANVKQNFEGAHSCKKSETLFAIIEKIVRDDVSLLSFLVHYFFLCHLTVVNNFLSACNSCHITRAIALGFPLLTTQL
jgi:hypothetical protein